MKNMGSFKFISNSEEIGGVPVITVNSISGISAGKIFEGALSEFIHYVGRNSKMKYCVDISKIKIKDISLPYSMMLKSRGACINTQNEEPYFLFTKYVMQMKKNNYHNFNIFYSRKELENFLSK